jgi:hypothetical protein
VYVRGELLQQPRQLREPFRRGQLVQIIDDQKGAVAVLSELGENPVGGRPRAEAGVAAGCSSSPDVPFAFRMAPRTASQNCCESCWCRRTWTTASRYG